MEYALEHEYYSKISNLKPPGRTLWLSTITLGHYRLRQRAGDSMLLGWWVGSKGSGDESFTIRVPINISPWSKIQITPNETPLNIAGQPATLFEEHGLYILEVYGFPSEEAANDAVPGVQVGLIWAALRHRLALPFPGQTAPVTYEELPITQETDLTKQFLEKGWEKLDGHYRNDQTVVKPEHKRLSVEAVGAGRLVLNTPDRDLADKISEAMTWPHPDKVMHHEKLRLAINLYSSSFFEANDNARFLTLMTVLEALNPNRPASEVIQSTVDRFKVQVKELRDSFEDDPNSIYEDYQYLLQRLGDLKKESIGKGIRALVREALTLDPEVDDPEAVAKEVAKIYGWRSDLVHTGYAEEGNVKIGIDRLMDIVPRVLMVLVSDAARP